MQIDATLVRRLITDQFPEWADLAIRPVEPGGWDNRTLGLGPDMSVRLPSHERYAAQVEKEQAWLPRLAPLLPLPIPVPLALGAPAAGYDWSWSVYGWLEGEPATTARVDDTRGFASDLARFLRALQAIDTSDGPPPGRHNFFRGGALTTYDAETRNAIAVLGDEIDGEAVTAAWEAGLDEPWSDAPVWVHGDVAPSNLLIRRGGLGAVIDFGCCAVGDPACDLAIAWTMFAEEDRRAFRTGVGVDEATWRRGRAWALWKALITLAQREPGRPVDRAATRIVAEIVADRRAT